MTRIGSVQNARIAATFFAHSRIAEGWTYISGGSYRWAYLGPDGIVYKVQHSSEYGDNDADCNFAEHQRYAMYGGRKWDQKGFRLARCRAFANGVLAMEHIPVAPFKNDRWSAVSNRSDTHPCAKAARLWARNALDAFDVCGDNYLVHAVTGELVIVDYAT